jgi:hypothetical protein
MSLSCLVLPVSSLMCASFSSSFVGRVESAAAYHTLYTVSYRPHGHAPRCMMHDARARDCVCSLQ